MNPRALLFISFCNTLLFHCGILLQCPAKWGLNRWTTIKYLTSCVTLVPVSKIQHCKAVTSNQKLPYGQEYMIECVDKYCEDTFPVGYFWTWIPDDDEEERVIPFAPISEWEGIMHGLALICTESDSPCVASRSNRSKIIQGESPKAYNACKASRLAAQHIMFYKRDCSSFRANFFLQNVEKHYVCLLLKKDYKNLYLTDANYCTGFNYTLVTCGHEGTYPCERNRTFGCNFNHALNRCVSYYYTKAPPDREKYQRCRFDYGSTCNCTCRNNYTQWTSWSSTCKPSSRMRIAPFTQPSNQLPPVHCSFENRTQCCVETEINLSSEQEECTNYIYGTNISLVKHNCSKPGGRRVVDEKGHFKCQCAEGYDGIFCHKTPLNCLSKPCKNGGTCSSDGHYYFCDCKPGFKGFQCEQSYQTCDKAQKCENGGVCKKSQGGYVCECIGGYTGVHCEYEVQYCEEDTCWSHGVCQNVTALSTYRCHCQTPYAGRRCEYAYVYCKADSCGYHGVCHNVSKTKIKCTCHTGYVGEFCNFNIYLSVVPVCICAAVFGALLSLWKFRTKGGTTTRRTVTRRRSSRSPHSPRVHSKHSKRSKAPEEVVVKPAKHDYVLPVFSSSSSGQSSVGMSTVVRSERR